MSRVAFVLIEGGKLPRDRSRGIAASTEAVLRDALRHDTNDGDEDRGGGGLGAGPEEPDTSSIAIPAAEPDKGAPKAGGGTDRQLRFLAKSACTSLCV